MKKPATDEQKAAAEEDRPMIMDMDAAHIDRLVEGGRMTAEDGEYFKRRGPEESEGDHEDEFFEAAFEAWYRHLIR